MFLRAIAGVLLCVFVSSCASSPALARPAGCPSRWCGCWMRIHTGISDPSLNLARNWARVGRDAGGPAVGVIVVWRHHVGIITGGQAGAWIVKSGNDSRAVRERVRSVDHAFAFRWP